MADSAAWLCRGEVPMLAEKELHIWRASLDLVPELIDRLGKTLNTSEKERAERFLVPRARERFIAGRGILRDLLAKYLLTESSKIDFQYGAEGKPSLSPVHASKICFSVSHSQNMALFAVALESELGIDIEQMRGDFRGMEIASHFFSDEEVAGLAKLSPAMAAEGFFSCWTKKEAYVKARGQGLGIPLRSFSVNFTEKTQTLKDEIAVWSCYALEPAPGFSGAVVVTGEDWKLRCCEWASEGAEFSKSQLAGIAPT